MSADAYAVAMRIAFAALVQVLPPEQRSELLRRLRVAAGRDLTAIAGSADEAQLAQAELRLLRFLIARDDAPALLRE
jgi:hypothetical protein